MCFDVRRHGIDRLENMFAFFGIGKFNAVILVEKHYELKSIDRIQAKPIAKQRIFVADIRRVNVFQVQNRYYLFFQFLL